MHRSSWLVTAALVGINIALVQQVATAKSAEEVGSIATAVTVEIKTENPLDTGSGILLQRQQDVYTILTAKHVVKNYTSLTIKTSDGTVHKFLPGSIRKSGNNLDLAILKFRSSKNYSLVNIGNSKRLQRGSTVYVTGFPNVNENIVSAGLLHFTDGKVTGVEPQENDFGYSLIYGNQTLPGMSGGPVLNENGELVAIHGRGEKERQQKTGRNLGIVVERFGSVALALGIQLDQPVATLATSTVANATDYYLAGIEKYYDFDFQGALNDFSQAISLDPKYALAYAFRGAVRTELNDVAKATADLNIAVILDPKSALTYIFSGALKSQQLNDFTGAFADINQGIYLDSKLPLAYLARSIVTLHKLETTSPSQQNLRELENALNDVNHSINLDPNFALAYIYRSRFYLINGQESSIKDLQKAAKLLRQKKHSRLLLAVIEQLRKQGANEME